METPKKPKVESDPLARPLPSDDKSEGPEKDPEEDPYVLVYTSALQFGKSKRIKKGEEIPADHFDRLSTGTQALFLQRGAEVSAALWNKLAPELREKFKLKKQP